MSNYQRVWDYLKIAKFMAAHGKPKSLITYKPMDLGASGTFQTKHDKPISSCKERRYKNVWRERERERKGEAYETPRSSETFNND